jgi:hypothetical protein
MNISRNGGLTIACPRDHIRLRNEFWRELVGLHVGERVLSPASQAPSFAHLIIFEQLTFIIKIGENQRWKSFNFVFIFPIYDQSK